ncbi:TrkA family potassium uptake protein [Frankia sp. CNm7]|uniref:Trk system potassium uptake protein TrkA n=1 Tax=Frankia nepalensis TaxID=1836974 RepID=A0A937UQ65_9ACTN|nr:TrkA family potassium uptake protein [Frankia nepalensis]MBL7499346.1 TrkA family potassium uptake protein [Frankia nepalensis]MBL7515206.1 TrkA family potassium uptake protein [Frankia nepalensis]MBL7524007.1 TrkA family potassium uptake protein [Frankia nepalensis]MBL7629882.1 TrkA family potassium uptake protein [Frankia nepalensis]
MHVVILGCGRVGSALALEVERFGHSVAVIDQDPAAFHRLSKAFGGRKVTGVGFDRDTLVEAGIEDADAFASVSSGDNSNIISARVAREMFGVQNVVARIYDPRRAEVYERLGIPTVATVRWTRDQILSRLLPDTVTPEWTHPSGHVVITQLQPGRGWVGRPVKEIEEAAGIRVACVTRFGDGVVPEPRTLVQDGDILHAAVPRKRASEAEAVVRADPAKDA